MKEKPCKRCIKWQKFHKCTMEDPYVCGFLGAFECDCPKCQGLCTCKVGVGSLHVKFQKLGELQKQLEELVAKQEPK